MTKMVAVRGAYGLGNFGDDALMVASYEIVKKAVEEWAIVFSCNDAPYIHKIVPGVRVVPQEGYQAFLRALVYAGGTQFYSFPLTRYDNSFGAAVNKYLSYISQPGRLVKRSYEKMRDLFCTLNGLHIAAIGVGLGPFV
jgi:polysaccharide pyruvyl transferase WcaK-like protein